MLYAVPRRGKARCPVGSPDIQPSQQRSLPRHAPVRQRIELMLSRTSERARVPGLTQANRIIRWPGIRVTLT